MRVTLKAPTSKTFPDEHDLGDHPSVIVGSYGVAVVSNGRNRKRLIADVQLMGGATVFVVDTDEGERRYREIAIEASAPIIDIDRTPHELGEDDPDIHGY